MRLVSASRLLMLTLVTSNTFASNTKTNQIIVMGSHLHKTVPQLSMELKLMAKRMLTIKVTSRISQNCLKGQLRDWLNEELHRSFQFNTWLLDALWTKRTWLCATLLALEKHLASAYPWSSLSVRRESLARVSLLPWFWRLLGSLLCKFLKS